MQIFDVNLIAVLAATIAAFVAGSIFYGVMAKPWMKAAGIKTEDAKMGAGLFALTFLCEFVLALVLARLIGYLVDGGPTIGSGLVTGVFVWAGFVMTTMIVNHRYGGRGWDLTFIDGAHWLVVVLVMGAVIGAIG